jgi:peroxiredoxin
VLCRSTGKLVERSAGVRTRTFVVAEGAACYSWSGEDFAVSERSKSSTDTTSARLTAESQRAKAEEPEVARAYDNLVERLLKSGAGAKAPKVGDRLPSFVLPDDEGRLVRLTDLVAAGPVIVSMNRGHWCSYCRIELEGLQEIREEVVLRGGEIVAITPDRQAYSRKLKSRCNLNFPVLSDIDNVFAMSLGLAVWCGEEVRRLYEAADLDLSQSQGNDGWLIPIPATYVLDRGGRIKMSYVNPDFRERIAPSEVLRAL